jgi:catechol 2,3-dioxygenase-like lactoylglutathione lyase family enzyme
MIKSIHHASYTVRDMDQSLRFYEEGLGFARYSDRTGAGRLQEIITGVNGAEARIAHLRGYGQGLELFQYSAPDDRRLRAVRPCDVGSSHLCFVVEDMDETIRHLERFGAEFLSEPLVVAAGPNAGNRYCYFLDPDGIPMELSQVAGEQDG